jgi:hypothetical protein
LYFCSTAYSNWDASYQDNILKLIGGNGRKLYISLKEQIYIICAFVAFY